MKKIAVIGGGISGLSFCHRLLEHQKKSPTCSFSLFEGGTRLGGLIETERDRGFVLEKGPDAFLTEKPYALDLCKRLGLENELLGTREENRKSFVLRKGCLLPLPEGFYLVAPTDLKAFLKTPIFSLSGKLRILMETLVPRRVLKHTDESVGSFLRRRFGRELFERVGQAMLAGIYTGDPELLSLESTMPKLAALEKEHGSVIRGLLKKKVLEAGQAGGPRYSLFASLQSGMARLTEALAARMPAGTVHLNKILTQAHYDFSAKEWVLRFHDGSTQVFDSLVLTLPAPKAAKVFDSFSALSKKLASITTESVVTLNLAYAREQISSSLKGFGFVVPRLEKSPLVACSFSSRKFSGRAPEGFELLRVFAGGSFGRQILEKEDAEISAILRAETEKLLGIRGEPVLTRFSRYSAAMVQYHTGHRQLVSQIAEEIAQLPNLVLIGNSYRGVGIPDSIREAEAAAERFTI